VPDLCPQTTDLHLLRGHPCLAADLFQPPGPMRLRAASARLWPDSTTRTASCLNSSLYPPRFPFLIFVSLSLLHQLAKGYVLREQAQPRKFPTPKNAAPARFTPQQEVGSRARGWSNHFALHSSRRYRI
jgi:hypothetical protein